MNAPLSPPPSSPRRSNSGLYGCLIVFLVVVLLAAVGVIWLIFNGKAFFAGMARDAVVQAIEQSQLPEAEKAELTAEIDRLQEAIERDAISYEELGLLAKELAESPVLASFVVVAVEAGYVAPSGLSPEEKEAAHRTLERVARGMIDETISEQELESALAIISRPGGGENNRQIKEELADDELRAFLAEAKRVADEAGVPDEAIEVDLSRELRRILDRVLGESAAAA